MSRPDRLPTLDLGDGVRIPQLGFGVFQVPPRDTERIVTLALEAGYRHIDTAAGYDNEEGVGRAIAASGLPRGEVFVTTKLWNADQGTARTRRAFERSLGLLGLDHVDLYLIHWPLPMADRYVETWETLVDLKADGRTRAIGVSNFEPSHLERLERETGTVPAINQVELHPYLQQAELRAFHAEQGIVTEAWSPLGQGGELLEDPVLARIAQAHDRTPAQVVLRWHLQIGNVVIPKSVTPERIRSNIDVLGFELSGEELEAIAGLDRGERLGPHPDTMSVGA